jgi:hypothetical protein
MNPNTNEFDIDRNDANARKIGGNGRINATGPYEGILTRAEARKSDKGSLGIEFDFKTADGATAFFLQVWRMNGSGEELSGAKIIDALMLLLRAKNMSPTWANVDKYDKMAGGVIKQKCLVYPEMMGKPIGMLLQKEHDEYQGRSTEKMIIYGCYDIQSRKTPMEIVDKKPAGSLTGIIASLKDKYPKNIKSTGTPAHHGTHPGARPASTTPSNFDDIPF